MNKSALSTIIGVSLLSLVKKGSMGKRIPITEIFKKMSGSKIQQVKISFDCEFIPIFTDDKEPFGVEKFWGKWQDQVKDFMGQNWNDFTQHIKENHPNIKLDMTSEDYTDENQELAEEFDEYFDAPYGRRDLPFLSEFTEVDPISYNSVADFLNAIIQPARIGYMDLRDMNNILKNSYLGLYDVTDVQENGKVKAKGTLYLKLNQETLYLFTQFNEGNFRIALKDVSFLVYRVFVASHYSSLRFVHLNQYEQHIEPDLYLATDFKIHNIKIPKISPLYVKKSKLRRR